MLALTKKTSSGVSGLDDDRIIAADNFIDFALTQKSVNISVKVDKQLESLRSFLDLLRMRISIQQDFTLGGVVHFFDPTKKGYITVADLKAADTMRSLDNLTDDDLHHFFGGTLPKPEAQLLASEPRISRFADSAEGRIEYQAFVKIFMPVTDKRFTSLIIQRSEKSTRVPPLSESTKQLAV